MNLLSIEEEKRDDLDLDLLRLKPGYKWQASDMLEKETLEKNFKY